MSLPGTAFRVLLTNPVRIPEGVPVSLSVKTFRALLAHPHVRMGIAGVLVGAGVKMMTGVASALADRVGELHDEIGSAAATLSIRRGELAQLRAEHNAKPAPAPAEPVPAAEPVDEPEAAAEPAAGES